MKTADLMIDAGVRTTVPLCCTGSLGDLEFAANVAWATFGMENGAHVMYLDPPASAVGANDVQLSKNNCFANGVPTNTDTMQLNIEVEATTRTHHPDLTQGIPAGYNTQEEYGREAVLNCYEMQRYTELGDPGDLGSSPLGHQPYIGTADGLKLRAVASTVQQRSQISPHQNPDYCPDTLYGDWLSAMMAQSHEFAQFGGVFKHCVKADEVAGQFMGGWLNWLFSPVEIDTFEYGVKALGDTSAPHNLANKAIHLWPETAADGYSKLGLNDTISDTSFFDMVCNGTNSRCICHAVRYRLTGNIAADGCAEMEMVFTTDGIVTDRAVVDAYVALHHAISLAISDGRNWVDGPPTVDEICGTVCEIETRQYNDFPTLPAMTRPVLQNVDFNWDPPYASNFTGAPQFATGTNPITPGSVPGWNLVHRKVRVSGLDVGATNPTSYTPGDGGINNHFKMVYVVERWQDPVTKLCFDLPSDGIYYSGS